MPGDYLNWKKKRPKSNQSIVIEADKTRKGRICVIVLFYLNINFTSELAKQCLLPVWKISIGIFSIVYFGPYEKKVEKWPDEVA